MWKNTPLQIFMNNNYMFFFASGFPLLLGFAFVGILMIKNHKKYQVGLLMFTITETLYKSMLYYFKQLRLYHSRFKRYIQQVLMLYKDPNQPGGAICSSTPETFDRIYEFILKDMYNMSNKCR